mmetsp:Transcript_25178/g.80801  ORF Transcript_25178/g.80801 Transcript_25178/m.80801 type:complete len:211 (+) Transcript_25178:646-1278(+)
MRAADGAHHVDRRLLSARHHLHLPLSHRHRDQGVGRFLLPPPPHSRPQLALCGGGRLRPLRHRLLDLLTRRRQPRRPRRGRPRLPPHAALPPLGRRRALRLARRSGSRTPRDLPPLPRLRTLRGLPLPPPEERATHQRLRQAARLPRRLGARAAARGRHPRVDPPLAAPDPALPLPRRRACGSLFLLPPPLPLPRPRRRVDSGGHRLRPH